LKKVFDAFHNATDA